MSQFATVVAIKGTGTAYAISATGKSRVLKVGDVLQKGESVRTSGDAVVQLLMIDGAILSVAPGQSVLLNEQVVDTDQRPSAADSAATTPAAIQAIIDALRAGVDLSEVLDPAAAGLTGGGGNDGGHSFVRLPRIVEGVEPLQFEYSFRAPGIIPFVRQVTIGEPDGTPSASVGLVGGVGVDETTDLNVAHSAQLVTISTATGADADGATVNVQLVIDQADSGLRTTAGQAIALVQGASDNEVVGMYDSNGDGVPDAIAFTVSLSDDGVVTVNQLVSLDHPDPATLVDGDTSSYDEAVNLAGRLSVRVTVVDGDGDVATATEAIGERITFEDDGPAIDVSGATGVDVPTLLTQDADTVDEDFDVATSSVSFANLFTVSANAGADQDGSVQSVTYALSVGAGMADTGLTSDGAPIMLVMDGADIVGRAFLGETSFDVFRVNVDASGNVTLTQYEQINHLPEDVDADNDNSVIRLPDGSVVLTATGTITDGDQDVATDSQAIDVSIAFGFEDDVPSVTVGVVADGSIVAQTQDAQTSGAASDSASASFAASFEAAVTPDYGADGPGSTTIGGYTLAVIGANSNLTSHGLAITLAMDGADVVGSTTEGAVFRISVDGSGTVTLTQYAQIDHLPEDIDATNDNSNVVLGDGLVTLSATATTVDFDNDTAAATVTVDLGGNLSFDDDVPSVTANAVVDGDIVLTTQDAQTIGVASDTASGSFAAAFLAAANPNYGADGPGSTTISGYSLAVVSANSGLTSHGLAITLAMDGSDVVGSTTDGAVFRISVDGSGTVTLTQYAQIDHLPEDIDATNDNTNIALGAGLVTLSATATTIDFDNDTATATVSVDLGGNLSFDDDIPSVTASAVADGDIVLTTQDAQTIGVASDTASASFAAAFLAAASPVYGADGPGSTSISSYSLAVVSANSGLTSHGLAITLTMDGADVVGSTTDGAVFRISVDSSGTVTLTQYAQIDHLPEDIDATNDNANVALGAGLVTLSATATTIDFDNDTATATVSVDLGGNLSFDDDVPSVTASAVADGAIVLTTQDAQTIGVASDTASASFAAAFLAAANPVYGADGPGSTSISGYSLAVVSANSGLTSHGLAITLAMDGSDVVGSTTDGAIFRISVDGSGTVTLTQYAQIDHLPEDIDAVNDNTNIALGNGLVTLSATATTVDFDNDTATATVSVDLGGNLSFDDDVPSVTAGAVADGAIVLTTQDAQTIGAASDTASASFAAAFLAAATPNYGADGPGSTTISGYSLAVVSANSGLTSHGLAITLAMDGSDVVGSTTDGAVFRISVDGSGTVTLTQYAQIDHLPEDIDATNDNSNVALGAGLVTLSATATTVDFDNDTATATVSVDLGGNLSFDDDVPSVTAGAVADGAIVLTTQDAQTIGVASDTASASFAAAFLAAASPVYGADGPGSTSISSYSLAVVSANSGLTSHGLAITLTMDGADVVGSTTDGAVFRISVDSSGTVTLTQYAQIDHLPEDIDATNDNSNVALGAGLVTLSATATTVDFDNDTATATVSVDLGGNLSFDDDVPSVTASAVADGAIVLTTQDAQTIGVASDTASASFAAAFLAAASPNYGADGPGSTTISGYSLAVVSADSGLASHGIAITLSMSGSDVIGMAGATEVFRISVDASGTVTLTQHAQIDHLPEDIDASNDNANIALGNGLVTLSATATTIDFDNDTATATVTVDLGGNLSFDDDVPSVTAGAVADGAIVMTTQDAQTIGVASDTASASFAAAFLAAASPVYGADGPGSTAISGYSLAVVSASSGLTSHGVAITLSMSGSDVIGMAGATEVFRISVDASGTVTLTQHAQIDHLPEDVDATNDNFNIALGNGLVTLSATATTIDFDNDTATATVSVDLGGNLSFDDDVPSVTAGAVADGAILLTTQDAQTIGLASDTASASFAAAFLAAASPVYGADGPGSTSISGYSLAVVSANSGLTSHGLAITLAMDGSDVVGSTTDGAVFRISVDSAGTVTLTQYAQIDHLPEDIDAVNDNTNIALGNGLVTLSATATTIDFDNDTATATVSVDLGGNLSFDDDVPSVTASAVADGAIVLTTQDAQTIGVASDTASASFAAAFLAAASPNYGADGPGSTSISGYSLAVVSANSGLTSGGLSITLAMDGADVVGSTTNGAVFRISVDSSGTVTLTQYAQIDHLPEDIDATNDNSNVALGAGLVTLSATATTVDFDNDTATATVTGDLGGNISFDDDTPSVLAKTDLIYANANNPSPGGTGIFDYAIGADSRTSYSALNSDFSVITLAGMVGATAIASPSVTWASETSSTAVFNISFSYAKDPTAPGVLTPVTGTLTFDKLNGTYTMVLNQPIESFSTLQTSAGLSFTGYETGTSTVDNTQPAVAVTKLTDTFFVQFRGVAEPGSGTGADNLYTSGDAFSGTFANGDLFTQAASWVSVSNASNGVAGDTMGRGEVLDLSFYSTNPFGNSQTPNATATGIFLQFDGIVSGGVANADLVVILKLVDPDDGTRTTKAIIVDSTDIYKQGDTLPTGYSITLDNNDGVVFIESNDYNIASGENWVIEGAQILSSTEGVTGTGVNLDSSHAASTTYQEFEGTPGTANPEADTVDNDGFKITNIGITTQTTTTQDASLTFQFTNVDADGDATATQTLNVTIEGSSVFTGTASAESIQAGAGNDTLVGGAGNDTMTGGGGVDIFKWTLGDQGTTATPAADQINDFTVGTGGDALDLRDLLQGELGGTDLAAATSLDQYLHFTEVGGKAVLEVDHDNGGTFAPTQTITFDNMSLADLTAALGLSSPATDLQIIQQMLAQDNLRNTA